MRALCHRYSHYRELLELFEKFALLLQSFDVQIDSLRRRSLPHIRRPAIQQIPAPVETSNGW